MDKQIIELESQKSDEGEIIYTPSRPISKVSFSGPLAKIFGIALGVAAFLLLITFFVYVVLPILLIVIAWTILRNVFSSRKI